MTKTKKTTTRKTTRRNSDGLEYVVATLPNGAKLNLYGDAVAEAKKTKHPYHETIEEKIERWAIGSVTSEPPQQLALISLLHAFSAAAGKHEDVESIINLAMYAAFKETDCMHDEAIAWTVSAAEEDRAVEFTKKHRAAKGGAQ